MREKIENDLENISGGAGTYSIGYYDADKGEPINTVYNEIKSMSPKISNYALLEIKVWLENNKDKNGKLNKDFLMQYNYFDDELDIF